MRFRDARSLSLATLSFTAESSRSSAIARNAGRVVGADGAAVAVSAARVAASVLTAAGLPEAQLEMLGLSLVGALAYAAMHWMQGGYRLTLEQMVDNAVRIIGGTAAGVGRPNGAR